MDLRKLSPSMLLTLGLACGDGKGSDDTTTVNACLSPPDPTEVETGPCLDVGPLITTGDTTSVGPCLSDESGFPSTGTSTGTGGSTFGPCLSPEPSTGTDTGTGTGSDTDTGTGTTTGPCLVPAGAQLDDSPVARASAAIRPGIDSRREALDRVLARGTLPSDVAERLRATSPGKRT
jgi:hypothetical protein